MLRSKKKLSLSEGVIDIDKPFISDEHFKDLREYYAKCIVKHFNMKPLVVGKVKKETNLSKNKYGKSIIMSVVKFIAFTNLLKESCYGRTGEGNGQASVC